MAHLAVEFRGQGKEESFGRDTDAAQHRVEPFLEAFIAVQVCGALILETLEKPDFLYSGIIRHRPQPDVCFDLDDLRPAGGNSFHNV